MFRLMALLCAGIYAVMLIGGQDRGQLRFGLMQAEADKAAQMHAAQLAQSKPATSAPWTASRTRGLRGKSQAT